MATNVAVLNFSGKGHNSPFPPFLRQYCLSLAGITRTSNRGLGSPHSADYTETLTPPIVHQDKRFTFGQNHAVTGPLGIFIKKVKLPRRHIGRGGIPACRWLHFRNKAVSRYCGQIKLHAQPIHNSRMHLCAHIHNAGGRADVSKAVPASGCSRP